MNQKINQKIGILGGGQLGKMLCQAGSRLGLNLHVMEKDESFPAWDVCANFVKGDITAYDDVLEFGKNMDIITIEIENVNVEALEALEKMGKKVYPSPSALNIIRDKGKQKIFYEGMGFPTSEFTVYKSKEAIRNDIDAGVLAFPFVQKLRTEGYDGRGVQVVRASSDPLFESESIVESLVDINKEIAVIVARNPSGQCVTYPVVEMNFHPEANLVEYLFSPSSLSAQDQRIAAELAVSVADELGVVGLLAVELFVDNQGRILVNEVAPRPHNSGHHTIEACYVSQFEMHLRALLDLPLVGTEQVLPAVMINLLGEPDYSGPVIYTNIETCLEIPGVSIHLYGKKTTKPFRKMGHVTVVDTSLDKAITTALKVKELLKVTA
ncbi:MAG: 5-(carboxyamino)imidazole ribonucleotide synthase [Chitinophagales bacterium]|nr:5-(carboxyamino)imidazole ribonucleotide synthase [Chitinophagales bacterium]